MFGQPISQPRLTRSSAPNVAALAKKSEKLLLI